MHESSNNTRGQSELRESHISDLAYEKWIVYRKLRKAETNLPTLQD